MSTFRIRGKEYTHVAEGWCFRQFTRRNGKDVWRLYWGVLAEGCLHPRVITIYEELDDYVDFDSLEQCIAWIKEKSHGV